MKTTNAKENTMDARTKKLQDVMIALVHEAKANAAKSKSGFRHRFWTRLATYRQARLQRYFG